uniref:COP9 signalosome complex subunit 4 n=1 Tax=Glossina pallidipes TaxID=7398 RepID=A0A1A9ZMW7_GLOPL
MVITFQNTVHRLVCLLYYSGAQADEAKSYLRILEQIISNTDHELQETFQVFITNMVSRRIKLAVSRSVLSEAIAKLTNLPDRIAFDLCKFALVRLKPRIICFEEHVCTILQHIGTIMERFHMFRQAAETLLTVPLERGHRRYAPEYKFDIYVRIARLFLEADDVRRAEFHIKRAALLQREVSDKPKIILYKESYARILDHGRKFIEAARQYVELSAISNKCMSFLRKAFICIALSTTGEQRSHILFLLLKDERTKILPGSALIGKLYHNVIIKRSDLKDFEAILQPHHKITLPNGLTLLERAINEHNLLSVSKVYNDISFEQLAALFETTPTYVQIIAAELICNGRIPAVIDQIRDSLVFENHREVPLIDMEIKSLCNQLNSIFNKIAVENPAWLAKIETEITEENDKTC